MMTIKQYVRAESLEQAYQLNQVRANRVLGGMLWLNTSKLAVNTAIDLSGLGLDQIEEGEDAFSIGAMVTLRQLELHPGLNAYTQGAMAKSVQDIVGVQFRNMATVGGSLFGRFGFSDVLTMFLALDAQVELYHAGTLSIQEFAQRTPDRDLLVRVVVRKRPGRFVYQSVRNTRTDLPTLTCAVSQVDGAYRLAVGARPMKAVLLTDEEGLLAQGITPESARAFGEYAARTVPTSGNLRGSQAYRTHLVQVLTQRGILELGGDHHGA